MKEIKKFRVLVYGCKNDEDVFGYAQRMVRNHAGCVDTKVVGFTMRDTDHYTPIFKWWSWGPKSSAKVESVDVEGC
jgi:hypothetical protein